MKRSDFIPDEELQRLLQLAEDAPGAITEQSKLAYECNREGIAKLDYEIECLKAEEEAIVNSETKADGKDKYGSIKARTDETNRRLLKDELYQGLLREKSFLETQRQQKFSQYYQDKDTFKAVLKKLGMAKALQETENLTIQIEMARRVQEGQAIMLEATKELKKELEIEQEAQHAEKD